MKRRKSGRSKDEDKHERESFPEGFAGPFFVDKCLFNQLITEVTQVDPTIKLLLDQAEELYSSLLMGETTLADATSSEFVFLSNSRRLQSSRSMNLPRPQRQAYYTIKNKFSGVRFR
ncbi:hypothetical protein DPMN_051058 [Dreissena polymorpha]|uniref:Uncharacterized protein n=1 Tax=Dreissena polymorpha TaxID=45954 RepID=A0A9D4CH80_DREPO|nr:hypothetical protein DPMN_051058 [Dreissena polymorpha]